MGHVWLLSLGMQTHTNTMQDWITEVKRDVDAQYAVNVLVTKSE